MQVKIILGSHYDELEMKINEFIGNLKEKPDIKYDLEKCMAVVEYETVAEHALCCDCKYWDDDGESLIGLCQMCGGRKRFSNKACSKFGDVRG